MALPKGTKRYRHGETGEIRYCRNPPNLSKWEKVGTPGSKNWRWVNNSLEEKYISNKSDIPEGSNLGRIK